MKTLNHKLIIYDSNCKVCSSLLKVVLKITSIPETSIRAYKDLPQNLNVNVDPDKLKNVMALTDTTGGETLPGISVLFSSAFMLYLHVHRVKHLEISQWCTVSWFLFLQLLPAYFNLKFFGL